MPILCHLSQLRGCGTDGGPNRGRPSPLDNSGRIKKREGEGTFHFHYQAEFEGLTALCVTPARVFHIWEPSTIAVADKGLATSRLLHDDFDPGSCQSTLI